LDALSAHVILQRNPDNDADLKDVERA
jgi:hypothetical protein